MYVGREWGIIDFVIKLCVVLQNNQKTNSQNKSESIESTKYDTDLTSWLKVKIVWN